MAVARSASEPLSALVHHAHIPDDLDIRMAVGPDGVAYWGQIAREGDVLRCRWLSPYGSDGVDVPLERIREALPGKVRLALDFPTVQPIGTDRLVIVGARSRWRGSPGPDHNAAIVTLAGEVVTTGCVGDGIAHVATDDAGSLWLGYIDEGVFGTQGWGRRAAEPIGSTGITQFDHHLRAVWRPTPHQVPGMADCYALNVGQRDVFACYYRAFPVVRVRDRQVRAWATHHGHSVLCCFPRRLGPGWTSCSRCRRPPGQRHL